MNIRKLLIGLSAASTLAFAGAAHASTITFDELTNGSFSGYVTYADVTSGGFLFDNSQHSGQDLIVWSSDNGFNADPGGATISTNYGHSTTTVTKVGGGIFTLGSIGLADVYNYAIGGDVLFTFYTAAFETSIAAVDTETVTLANMSGLQTFTFNRTGLTAFSYQGVTTNDGFIQVDNVVIDPTGGVPEPGAWVLMILGFGAVGATLRRRQAAPA